MNCCNSCPTRRVSTEEYNNYYWALFVGFEKARVIYNKNQISKFVYFYFFQTSIAYVAQWDKVMFLIILCTLYTLI